MAVKPILIYDGDCGFCRRWIERWKKQTGSQVDYAPYQEVGGRFSHLSEADFKSSVQLVESDGKTYRGAEAVFRSLAAGGSQKLLWAYYHVPGMRWTSEALYRLVATNRTFFSKIG